MCVDVSPTIAKFDKPHGPPSISVPPHYHECHFPIARKNKRAIIGRELCQFCSSVQFVKVFDVSAMSSAMKIFVSVLSVSLLVSFTWNFREK